MFDKFSFSNIWENDGIFISIIGYLIVFLALLFLSIIITNFQKILLTKQREKLKSVGHKAADTVNLEISGEVSAAISLSLHLHFQENHDVESAVLTIRKVQRAYSPWSSKIYGLREYPKK